MEYNLTLRSNLMIDDNEHADVYLYQPGDLVLQISRGPEGWPYSVKANPNAKDMKGALREEQWIEMHQYLICNRCKRPCAGTCEQD